MTVDRPSTYYLEWSSAEDHERLKKAAIADGSYSEDHDDWFEPPDISRTRDAGEDIDAARKLASSAMADSYYGEVNIYVRRGVHRVGAFWDYDDSVLLETVLT